MISAISSQPAGAVYPSVIATSSTESKPGEVSRSAAAGGAQQSAAPVAAEAIRSVMVSISDAAKERAAQYEANGGEDSVMRTFIQRMPFSIPEGMDYDTAIKQHGADQEESMRLRFDMAKADRDIGRRTDDRNNLAANQAAYDRLLKTDPKPAQELTGADREAAFDILRARGLGVMGDSTSFADENTNIVYSFRKDGSVWVHDADVPTTAESKRDTLARYRSHILNGRLKMDDLVDQRASIQSRYDGLQAKWAKIEA